MVHDFRGFLIGHLTAHLDLAAQAIDIHEPFSRYGLDSRKATELAAALSRAIGRPLPATLVWEYPTIEALSRHLEGRVEEPTARAQSRVSRPAGHEPIAVVGMACRFPKAPDPQAFWRILRDGVDAVTLVPKARWNVDALHDADPAAPGKMNTRHGGFLDQVDGFDPQFFGISPREANHMDPQQRLMLEIAWEALEDAGVPPGDLAGSATGVFAGAWSDDYGSFIAGRPELVSQHTETGQNASIIAARVSYTLGLQGPSLTVNTACSSSLVAIHLACQSLQTGDSSVALAGGVNLILAPESTVAMSKFGGLSPDGRCFTFDARANGYVRAEGCGVVVLKRLSQALADGDHIHGVIRGSAVNNDGASNGLTAPNPAAQEQVARLAYARAGVDPAAVHYVEAHGTGTKLGDPIEIRALGAVLCAGRAADRPLLVGSVKTNIGHTEAAAGMASLIKVLLSMKHRQIPASLHFQEPNPHIPFDDLGIVVPTSIRPWPGDGPALAGVSSFGFGGTNAHIVLEGPGAAREVVFVFSGQGGQWPGMGSALLAGEPVFRAVIERCEEVIQGELGWSLIAEMGRPAGESRLFDVEIAWPAVVSFEIALAALWRSWGIEPSAVVGHSIGEIAAAHVAGALSLGDALRVVCAQARLIRRAQGRGAMGLVGLSWDDAGRALSPYEGRLFRAIHADPESTVLTGDGEALGELFERLGRASVFCHRVPGSVAAHSPALRPLADELRERLRGLWPTRALVPFVSAVTASTLEGEALDADYWARNFVDPVLFSMAIASLAGEREAVFLEISPHPIVRRSIESTLRYGGGRAAVLPSIHRGEDESAAMLDTLGALYTLGVPGRWSEASPDVEPNEPAPAMLLPLSAKSPEALSALARSYRGFLTETTASLQDIAHAASVRRSHHAHRLALVGASRAEIARSLEAFGRGEVPPGAARGKAGSGARPKLVFVFSGQGSQRVGMGQDLLRQEPVFRATIEACDALVRRHASFSLLEALAAPDATSRLQETEIVQPALFAVEAALAALWASWGVTPDAVVGHSVGEIAAAHVAGILSLEEAVRLSVVRGRVMQQATGLGKMAAVTMTEEEASVALQGYEGRLSIAAHNDPRTVVLSGETAALEEVRWSLQRQKVPCRMLPVSYAFHSPQMAPFEAALVRELGALSPGRASIAMYSTGTGAKAEGEALDAAYWARNIRAPVRFAPAIGAAIDDGHRLFVEVGPTPVLTINLEQCLAERRVEGHSIPTLRRRSEERRSALQALGALYAHGHAVDWRRLHGSGRRSVTLPAYPWQRQRCWLDEAPPAEGLRGAEATGHPLLGAQVPMAGAGAVFEAEMSPATTPYLADHRVLDWAVVPAAAILEMVRAAATAHLGASGARVEGLTLSSPLVLREKGPRRVQVVVGEDAAVTLYSQPAGARPGEPWRAHATARVRSEAADVQPPPVDLDGLRARCGDEAPVAEAYAALAAAGLPYGPAFQGMKALWRGEGEALARVELPPGLAADASAYGVHPALLDAALQTFLATAETETRGALYLPFEIGGFAVHVAGATAAWVHARVSSGAEVLSGELTMMDDQGRVVAAISDLRMKRADAAALRRAESAAPARALHALTWRETPSAEAEQAPWGSWLVLTDGAPLGPSLVERLRAAGARCVTVAQGTREDFEAAVAAADLTTQPLRGVVCLWGAELCAPPKAAEAWAVTALHLVQALAARRSATPLRMWWVTRGAQAVYAGDPVSPAAASLWGLGRVVAAEKPDLGCTLVDLEADSADALEALWRVISRSDDETQVALRGGKRFAARLVEAPKSKPRFAVPAGDYRLEIPQKGTFDRLRLAPAARRAPGPGEVEIRVRASGLNFRDVLNALGMYPGEAGPLGLECAGEVAAVGEGVSHLSIGDAVMALSPGAFGRYVTIDARFAVRQPDGLSPAQAATVPVVFLTAWYALRDLGRLSAGERVLIHAAAGGVGMAAVQIARWLGATVLATASPAKWPVVRAMGVEHVESSRTTAFAAAFREATKGAGVDVVLHALAGELTDASLSLLSPGGRFLEMGKTDIRSPESIAASHPGVAYHAFDLLTLDPDRIQTMLRALVEGFAAGRLCPLPVRAFAVTEAEAAFEHMARARHVGKVALLPAASAGAEGTVLVTGGVGALGLEVARWLWESHRARHLVLVSRRAPEGRSLAAVEALRAAGARVTVAQADVADPEAVRALVASLGEEPPLRGVFHLAGVLDDGVLDQQSAARFANAMGPKVRGAWNLHEATRRLPLDGFVMFSSVASLLGNAGQANYAAANAFLDGLAHARRAEGLPALSLGWGPWTGGGMAARLDGAQEGRFARMGIGALSAATGTALLEQALARPEPQLGVFPLDAGALARSFDGAPVPPVWRALALPSKASGANGESETPATWASRLAKLAPEQRMAEVEEAVRADVAKVLSLPSAEDVPGDRAVQEIGLDSLMAVELRNKLAARLGAPLPTMIVFEHPTPIALARYLAGRMAEGYQSPKAAPPPPPGP